MWPAFISRVSKLSLLSSHKKPGLVFGSLIWELTLRNGHGSSVCETEKEGSPSVMLVKLTTADSRSHCRSRWRTEVHLAAAFAELNRVVSG